VFEFIARFRNRAEILCNQFEIPNKKMRERYAVAATSCTSLVGAIAARAARDGVDDLPLVGGIEQIFALAPII
ncbi:hypothetical protein OAO87_03420, partial [bacterium]|nr:hypothetical protein [bacterium]